MRARSGERIGRRALLAALILLGATAVAGAVTLAGTTVLAGCPCTWFDTPVGETGSAAGLGALAIGALLAAGLAGLALSAPSGESFNRKALQSAGLSPRLTRDPLPAGDGPVKSVITVTARKDRFTTHSSHSAAGLTHSPV